MPLNFQKNVGISSLNLTTGDQVWLMVSYSCVCRSYQWLLQSPNMHGARGGEALRTQDISERKECSASGVDHEQASNREAFPDIPVCDAGLGPLPALAIRVTVFCGPHRPAWAHLLALVPGATGNGQ